MKIKIITFVSVLSFGVGLWHYSSGTHINEESDISLSDAELIPTEENQSKQLPKARSTASVPANTSSPSTDPYAQIQHFNELDYSEKVKIKKEMDLALEADLIRPEDSEEYVQLLIKEMNDKKDDMTDELEF